MEDIKKRYCLVRNVVKKYHEEILHFINGNKIKLKEGHIETMDLEDNALSAFTVIDKFENLLYVFPMEMFDGNNDYSIIEVSIPDGSIQDEDDKAEGLYTSWDSIKIERIVPIEEYNSLSNDRIVFDEKGRVTKFINGLNDCTYIIEYNEKNQIIHSAYYDKNGIYDEVIREFNEKGLETKKVVENRYGKTTILREYKEQKRL